MIDDAPVRGMNIVLVGGSSALEELYGWGCRRPGGGATWFVSSSTEVLDIAKHNRVHLVLIEPRTFRGTALVALKLREVCPEAVIAFFGDDDEVANLGDSLDVRTRLSHYYRVARGAGGMWSDSADSGSFTQLLRNTAAWHETYAKTHSYPVKYEYDVALTFAGEDRTSAEFLANSIKEAGLRVFYDDFEKANLWGKDLFSTLYEVYSVKSLYCIMLISRFYVEKQWTVHERRSAQERVLSERDNEYLLPVRLDDTSVPGLPKTIAYLDASIGMEAIAKLLQAKLAQKLAVQIH